MNKLPALSSNQKKIIRKLHNKKYRKEYQMYLCEGMRLFQSAVSSEKITINEIIISESFKKNIQAKTVIDFSEKNHVPIYSCTQKEIRFISAETTPPGILFTVKNELSNNNYLNGIHDDILLFFENISEPGNLGTIIRTAVWFGVKTLLLSGSSVDPYNPKTVRASAGAIFECNIYDNINIDDVLTFSANRNYTKVATVPQNGQNIHHWKLKKKNIIFFGAEASGLSENVIKNADILITIPGVGKVESLNIAVSTGIFLAYLK